MLVVGGNTSRGKGGRAGQLGSLVNQVEAQQVPEHGAQKRGLSQAVPKNHGLAVVEGVLVSVGADRLLAPGALAGLVFCAVEPGQEGGKDAHTAGGEVFVVEMGEGSLG